MRVWGYFRIHAFRSIDYRSLSSEQASFASESPMLWCAEKQVGLHGPSDGNTETYADRIGGAPGESFWKYARRDRHLLWINSALHPSEVAEFSTSFGWEKGGNVISAGWQVTLCVTAAAHEVRRAGVLTYGSCHLERSARPHPRRGWSCQVPKTAEITLF